MKTAQTTLTQQELYTIVTATRPCSQRTFKRWLQKLEIKPSGKFPTRPPRYSLETPAVMLEGLGEPKIDSLAKLKSIRDRSLAARRAA